MSTTVEDSPKSTKKQLVDIVGDILKSISESIRPVPTTSASGSFIRKGLGFSGSNSVNETTLFSGRLSQDSYISLRISKSNNRAIILFGKMPPFDNNMHPGLLSLDAGGPDASPSIKKFIEDYDSGIDDKSKHFKNSERTYSVYSVHSIHLHQSALEKLAKAGLKAKGKKEFIRDALLVLVHHKSHIFASITDIEVLLEVITALCFDYVKIWASGAGASPLSISGITGSRFIPRDDANEEMLVNCAYQHTVSAVSVRTFQEAIVPVRYPVVLGHRMGKDCVSVEYGAVNHIVDNEVATKLKAVDEALRDAYRIINNGSGGDKPDVSSSEIRGSAKFTNSVNSSSINRLSKVDLLLCLSGRLPYGVDYYNYLPYMNGEGYPNLRFLSGCSSAEIEYMANELHNSCLSDVYAEGVMGSIDISRMMDCITISATRRGELIINLSFVMSIVSDIPGEHTLDTCQGSQEFTRAFLDANDFPTGRRAAIKAMYTVNNARHVASIRPEDLHMGNSRYRKFTWLKTEISGYNKVAYITPNGEAYHQVMLSSKPIPYEYLMDKPVEEQLEVIHNSIHERLSEIGAKWGSILGNNYEEGLRSYYGCLVSPLSNTENFLKNGLMLRGGRFTSNWPAAHQDKGMSTLKSTQKDRLSKLGYDYYCMCPLPQDLAVSHFDDVTDSVQVMLDMWGESISESLGSIFEHSREEIQEAYAPVTERVLDIMGANDIDDAERISFINGYSHLKMSNSATERQEFTWSDVSSTRWTTVNINNPKSYSDYDGDSSFVV